MQVVRKIKEMQEISDRLRREEKRIGLVPTMGYLHEAHLSLVRKAKASCDVVVTSIFVNPTQFGPDEDFKRYPRDEKGDKAKLEGEGVDFLFIPESHDMFPAGYQTYVDVAEVSRGLCGDFRPGHFRGVATVVAKLLNIIKPHAAVFGEKDYQQLIVIKKMAKDLDFDIEIIPGVLIREEDGLAMSSRNAYLSPEERRRALVLYHSLIKGKDLFSSGEKKASILLKTVKESIESMKGISLQYVEIRDADTFEKVKTINGPSVMAVAAVVGKTRLIDNMILGRSEED